MVMGQIQQSGVSLPALACVSELLCCSPSLGGAQAAWSCALHALAPLACGDGACLVVDLYERRWRVVHMSAGARHLLGYAQDDVQLLSKGEGKGGSHPFHAMPLKQLFDIKHNVAEQQAGRWEFALHRVPGAAGTAAMHQCFDLHFKVATLHDLDAQQPLGLCTAPRLSTVSASGLFLVHMHKSHKSAAAPACISLEFPDPLRSAFSGVKGGYAAAVAAAFMPRGVAATPIEGLVLGPLMGRGSSGHVHRGVYRGSPVAVKIIDDFSSVRCNCIGQPLEAALTSGHHEGLLRAIYCTFGANCTDHHTRSGSMCAWMLFDYCDKGCLADAIKKGWFSDTKHGSTHLRTVAVTALEIASAMAHLHADGITHGDLSCGNILLHTSASNHHGFSAKVSDFGLASSSTSKCLPSSQGYSRTGSPSNMCGTITHMPPEVLSSDDAAATPAADVYSFGVLLWEMLTGSRAWAGCGPAKVVFQVLVLKQGLPVPAGLPAALSGLLSCCLAQQAADRCSFGEAALCLEQYLA